MVVPQEEGKASAETPVKADKKSGKAEEKEVEIIIAGEIPEIEIKSLGQYEIEVDAVQIEDEGGGDLALVVPADIPDPQARSFGRYDANKVGQAFIMEASDIDVHEAGPIAHLFTAKAIDQQARYLRIVARNMGTIPDWHRAKGAKAWLFADEIRINARPKSAAP